MYSYFSKFRGKNFKLHFHKYKIQFILVYIKDVYYQYWDTFSWNYFNFIYIVILYFLSKLKVGVSHGIKQIEMIRTIKSRFIRTGNRWHGSLRTMLYFRPAEKNPWCFSGMKPFNILKNPWKTKTSSFGVKFILRMF